MSQNRQIKYQEMSVAPKPKTWSAIMPAYCYTELCPVKELRRGWKGGDANAGQEAGYEAE